MKNSVSVITFQEIIDRLDSFWGSKGCVIGQPYGMEVGAGTSNPNTVFRSLGPEPFNVAYVEPSRRPDDGRYGQNPYRLQHYYQYQIILKPAPKNNQELYLESLKALGIDISKHDVRFVEDNWEAPAIGAWGLGWEVWLDGMEVTQYTYFQQILGVPLEMPVLEITLGLERLAMYIQGVDDYREIMLNNEVKYGHLFEQHEYWQSTYNYETANIVDLEKLYSLMKSQIYSELDNGNYWVAYDYLLKISHIFNILDSRGVISVTDRISRFDVMGKVSNRIGNLYLDEREKLKYPLSKVVSPIEFELDAKKEFQKDSVTKGNKLVVELYFEELPAGFVQTWRESYYRGDDIGKWLEEFGLGFGSVKLYWTNRRVVFVIEDSQDVGELKKEIYGPMYDIAYTDGKLNKVGKGFLSKNEATQKDVVKVDRNGRSLLGISTIVRKPMDEILVEIIQRLVNLSPSSKKMKWAKNQRVSFLRPLRNIICFKNNQKIDIDFWGVKSSDHIFCTRSSSFYTMKVSSAQNYLKLAKEIGVVLDETYREGLIRDVVEQGRDRYEYSENTEAMIKTNVFLSEFPNIKFFTLDKKYSDLPIELIRKVLEDNQKYIIRTLKEDKKHVEYGIVANKKGDASLIYTGNRKVVQGRLDDALFYWERDLGVNLKKMRKELSNIVFHPKIGSYKDKVDRINKLVNFILKNPNVNVDENIIGEALQLIKNDKATNMVKEFASLEGVIGKYYAKRDGYSKKVSDLLYEHYLEKPSTKEAVVIALADKLDNILVFTKLGGLPQGSSDPYDIRKNVYSIIRLLKAWDLDIDMSQVIKDLEVLDFLNQRVYQTMKSETDLERLVKGISYSESGSISKKFKLFDQIKELVKNKESEDKIFDTVKRVYNILEKEKFQAGGVKKDLLETNSEKDLYSFILTLDSKGVDVQDLLVLSDLLGKFFEETMVNVDEKDLKSNRLNLLAGLRDILKMILVI